MNDKTGPTSSRLFGYTLGFLVLVLLALQFAWAIHGDEDNTFRQEWKDAFVRADKLFVANGLCPTTTRQCMDKNTMFVRGVGTGFEVEIYGITDPQILNQVNQLFIDEFVRTPNMMILRVKAYPLPYQEYTSLPKLLPFWDSHNQIQSVEILRRK